MNSFKRKALSVLLVFSLLVGIVGIVNVDTTYAASKKIHIWWDSPYIAAGNTSQQKLINKNGKTITATKVKWTSKKPSVAKISKTGKITAIKPGKAKMTAKYKGKTYGFTVEVYKPMIYIPVIRSLSYDSGNGIVIQLDKPLGDAHKCEIYYSINGGPFTLFETQKITNGGKLTYVDNINAKLVGTYTFKLRGICGKYKGKFSEEKSISFIPSIIIEPNKLVLKFGETKTIKVYTQNVSKVQCKVLSEVCPSIKYSFGGYLTDDHTAFLLNITRIDGWTDMLYVYDYNNEEVGAYLLVE